VRAIQVFIARGPISASTPRPAANDRAFYYPPRPAGIFLSSHAWPGYFIRTRNYGGGLGETDRAMKGEG